MDPVRWHEIERLYHAALARDVGARVAFLRETCADDVAMQREVELLLAQQASAEGCLAKPALAVAAQMVSQPADTMLIGRHIGVYRLQSLLGAGGMGEVYRARDTQLGRDVAIKILPRIFTNDPERLRRFEREARMLAALNHPHIGAIYGVEEADGVRALVLELVEGETLADRLQRGPAQVAETLTLAHQIADALDAAHEKGIIHRDLKPANIKVTPDGVVKVLDFGLAKAATGDGSTPDLTQSPTVTVGGTRDGVILGTAAYMSPEQTRGQAVDRRTDIWAFGCVLYEMLTGQRAFAGDKVSDTLASVLAREPDWGLLPSTVSPVLGTYLRRCLQKDLRQRVQAIGDVRLALEGAFETAGDAGSHGPDPASVCSMRRRVALASAAALLVGAVVATTLTWIAMRPPEPAPPRVSRLPLAPSGTAALTLNGVEPDLAITPDGARLIYVGNRGTQLFVRALDALEPVAVFTGAPRGPFVSPDGQWIGFTDGNSVLKKVAVAGGLAVTLATLDGFSGGATWGPEDTIIVATFSATTGLQRVAAAGGPTTVLTRPGRAQGETDHLWPEMLPGGRAVLFTVTAVTGGLDAASVAVLDLQTGTRTVLVRGGSHAHYVQAGGGEGGYLVYAAAGALRAVPFDLAHLQTRGTPVPVIPAVVTTPQGGVEAVVAGDGTLAYVSGSVAGRTRTLVWVDRQGRETPIPAPSRRYVYPRLSPDGTRVAVFAQDQEEDVWVWDLGRTTLTRATFDPSIDSHAVWTPDGRRVIFSSDRAGERNLFWQAADGTGAVERLSESPNQQNATAVSPDGRLLIFTETAPKTGDDVMQMALDGTRRVTPLVQSPFTERSGVVSPDGRWLAYEANESGRFEISVRPFPEVNSGRWQVSTAGGTRPLWARSGQELFYVAPTGALMRVGVERALSWAATTPTLLVKDGYSTSPGGFFGRTYDISPDGQRFLMIKEGGGTDQTATPPSLIVVQHWVEELKRLVPTK
jgi:serine/threonine-protein kinase